MCGICGIVGQNRAGLIERMTSVIAHRGPDDEGYYRNRSSGVELGMRRLSIIDLATGQQPIFNEDGTIAIVFNGEIYNYKQLASTLKTLGHQFKTQADTEVIVHGYEEYGLDVIKYLTGMFVFALWDNRKQQLILARDRLGIKPLYYTLLPDKLLFGSEVKCLLQANDLPRRLNPRAICEYMLFGFLTSDEQPIAGIRMLQPGCCATYQRDQGLKITRYWNPANIRPDNYSLEEATAALRATLQHAVSTHMIADVEVGLTLSGGVDSSIVLAYMAKTLGENAHNITAFTTGYGLSTDEFPAARRTAKHYSISTHEHLLSFDEVISVLPDIIWHVEEPIPHVTNFSNYFWSHLISQKIKVVQIGEGSDEIFGGYAHYHIFDFPWNFMPSPAKKHIFRLGYLMPVIREIKRLLNPEFCPPELVDEVYRQDYLDRLDNKGNLYHAFLLHELQNELPNSQLLRVDKLMMAHSVEARVPFLDHKVVELALSIDNRFKRQNGIEKYVLRKAVEKDLPLEVAYKAKYDRNSGSQPIMQELLKRGLWHAVEQAFRIEKLNHRGIFNQDTLAEYVYSEKKIPIFGTRMRDKFLIFALMLEVWFQLFMDRPQPTSPRLSLGNLLELSSFPINGERIPQ